MAILYMSELVREKRHRTRAVWASMGLNVVLWVLVLSGPVLGGLAYRAVRSVPEPAAPKPVLPVAVEQMSVQFVGAWLAADSVDDLAPWITLTSNSEVVLVPRRADGVWLADAAPLVRGWELVVAAQFTEPSVASTTDPGAPATTAAVGVTTEYYRVEVDRLDETWLNWQLTGLPAEVPAPVTVRPLSMNWDAVIDGSDPRVATVQGWLDAYLVGVGDPARFLAADVETPRPAVRFESVVIEAARVTGSETEPVLMVDVLAADADGAVTPMSYSFALRQRDGRWEISAVFPRSFRHAAGN